MILHCLQSNSDFKIGRELLNRLLSCCGVKRHSFLFKTAVTRRVGTALGGDLSSSFTVPTMHHTAVS
jgi:hypothetical protein